MGKYTARAFVARYGFLKLRSRAVVWLYGDDNKKTNYILQLKDMDKIDLELSPYKLRKMVVAVSEKPAHPIKHPSKTNDGGSNGGL